MRKRILAAALLLILLLCGCTDNAPKAFDLSIADELLASGAFEGSEMAPLDLDVAAMLYGIDRNTITDGVYYMAVNTSVSADELLVLIFNDDQSAAAAMDSCSTRIEQQIAVCKDYCPAAIPRLESAQIRRIENTLLLAVGDPAVLHDYPWAV